MQVLEDHLAHVMSEISTQSERGSVADYIAPLAKVPPSKFGMAVCTAAGEIFQVGDAEEAFSIQSVSKVFALTLALMDGEEDIWQRIGREPSGTAFNSIVQLESERGIPRNPFINPGAIVVADILTSRYGYPGAQERLLDFMRIISSGSSSDISTVRIDAETAFEESLTGHRNFALAHDMRVFGNIHNDIAMTLDTYFHQCALTMNCVELARAGRYLMGGGIDPSSGAVIASADHVRTVLALMMMCGHYDASGNFSIKVGLPGKSGVGGGILSIAPNVASIAVWSPGLCKAGNSLLGTLALEHLVQKTGWSVF